MTLPDRITRSANNGMDNQIAPSVATQRIMERLLAGHSLLVLAGPGMDVGRLISRVATQIRRSSAALVVSVAPHPFDGWLQRLDHLVTALRRALMVQGHEDAQFAELASHLVTSPGGGPNSPSAPYDQLEDLVAALDAEAIRIVVMIGELRTWLHQPESDAKPTAAMATPVSLLLHLQQVYRLCLLATDGPEVDVQASAEQRALMAGFERIWLSAWRQEEVEALLDQEYAALDSDDHSFIWQQAGGHPQMVRALAEVLSNWRDQGRALDAATRNALSDLCRPTIAAVVEETLRRLAVQGHGWAAEQLNAIALKANSIEAPTLLQILEPYGLVSSGGHVAEQVRRYFQKQNVRPLHAHQNVDQRPESNGPAAEDPAFALSRKERLIFNYLRKGAGRCVPWQELSRSYFSHEPDVCEDEEKALPAVRAAINRINAKLIPAEANLPANLKVIRYKRGEGFYVHLESLNQIMG